MDNSSIYEKLLIDNCFNKIKSLRNSWTQINNTYESAFIIDIGGSDHSFYDYIMEQCESIIIETILAVVVELINAYDIETRFYQIIRDDAHIYFDGDNKVWPSYTDQNNKQRVLIFSCNDENHNGILYIFKKFGINNDLPQSLVKRILAEKELKSYRYISLVEDNAYMEDLAHNNDPADPSRGTGVYSLKQFFNSFFDENEYTSFKTYTNKLSNMTKDYLGFEIVRTLRPNTIHNFRKAVRDTLYKTDFSEIDKDGIITSDQRKIIENNLFVEHNIELLTGTSLFAQSFMTSEWLFLSLSSAGNIDMTPIVMGYYKSIEQFLFSYISLHTKEKDNKKREVFAGKKIGYAELTDSLIADKEKTKNITMSSLTGFFGYHEDTTKPYITRNTDLLSLGINTNTYYFVIDVLSKVPETRNELFHKHNLTEWSEVIDARKCALQVFSLVLGSYRIDKADQTALGMLNSAIQDDFNNLCEYVENRMKTYDSVSKRPIFYFDANAEPGNCWIAREDNSIEYDEYGEPKYSGLYFIRPGDKKHVLKITKQNSPSEIWEGEWDFSGKVPNFFGQSGPKIKLFENGKFML